jgi:hypothetical protein
VISDAVNRNDTHFSTDFMNVERMQNKHQKNSAALNNIKNSSHTSGMNRYSSVPSLYSANKMRDNDFKEKTQENMQ